MKKKNASHEARGILPHRCGVGVIGAHAKSGCKACVQLYNYYSTWLVSFRLE